MRIGQANPFSKLNRSDTTRTLLAFPIGTRRTPHSLTGMCEACVQEVFGSPWPEPEAAVPNVINTSVQKRPGAASHISSTSQSRTGRLEPSEVRVTIRIPDATDPFALWCVFGKHQPTQAQLDGDSGRVVGVGCSFGSI